MMSTAFAILAFIFGSITFVNIIVADASRQFREPVKPVLISAAIFLALTVICIVLWGLTA